jgi:hypothetical protein
MSPGRHRRAAPDPFDRVISAGLGLPEVEDVTRRDGSHVLKRGGCFMAALATHPSAEPGTLVVRYDEQERGWLLEDAPEAYYLTDYYRRWPLILARLSAITPDALRDLLAVSWRLTGDKIRPRVSRGA